MIRLFNSDGSRKEIVRNAESNVSFLYPFRQMAVGDYFVVDIDPEKRDTPEAASRTRAANKLESAASQFAKRNPPIKFMTKRSKDRKIITVTRTA